MGFLNLDTIIMIIYLAAMLGLGIYCARFIKTFDDFFVAGRRLGFPLAVGTMSALFVGGSAIGVAGMGHDYGIGAIWYYVAYGIGFTALGLTFVVPLRAMNEYTVADIFARRYGERVRFISSIITFFAWVFFFAAFVVAGARVVEVLLGWPLWVSILVTAGIFTVYTSVGGMWAVTMTDFVQFVILVGGLVILFPISISAVGGFSGLYESLDPGMFSLIPTSVGGEPFTVFQGLGYIVATLVVTGMTGIVGPDVYIRVWCAKDNRTAKNVLYAVTALIVVGAIMLALIGMCANVLNPDIEHEMSMPWMIRHLLPPGLAGIILVALMAAAISGAVPELVVCSSILARDLYQRAINPKASEKQLLKMSRILTFAVGVVGMALAIVLPGFMDLTYHCYRIFVPAIAPITIAAFYSRKTSAKSALVSMIVGAVTAIFCIVAFPESYLTWADPVIVALIASIAALLIGNQFFTSDDPERENAFVDFSLEQIAAYKEEKKARKLAKTGQKSGEDAA
ncbi:sodium:solute symporter [Adlercreutzia sp. ZJ138]|uniref:sodium:solute symporter family protein n=1 Tax=Adlercreutzia sp. ZJ138 TaxID=2709405 RepID=UPI0013EC48FD|nr:hypothetical protein [Adlercreutzia sp. ZJ138]